MKKGRTAAARRVVQLWLRKNLSKEVNFVKKFLVAIITCILSVTLSGGLAYANGNRQNGFVIEFNGEVTDRTSVICNNTHYVPMRMIFEKMGAALFYRERDRQVMALSRDGNIIRHIVGENTVTVNEEQMRFKNPSFSENGETYIPIDMVAVVFRPDRISYDNLRLIIQKQFADNEYYKIIKDVLDVCRSCNFYPERFQRYINYHTKMPGFTMQEVIYRVNLGLDYPFYENVSEIENPYELLVLVNKYHRLPPNFRQYNLVNMSPEYTVNDGKQYLLAGVAYEKFVQMSDAAKKEGLTLKVLSAYRTEDYQRGLYNNSAKNSGKTHADNYSARPGFSEHETGLAVDINSVRGAFENTSEFAWLQKHAHEYGFILRYQKGKEWITGYAYEPWHYRYVGADAARVIHEEGITYEEYYAKYISVIEFR